MNIQLTDLHYRVQSVEMVNVFPLAPTVAMNKISSFYSPQQHQPQHIAQILPEVLARYGIGPDFESADPDELAPIGIGYSAGEGSLIDLALSLSVS